MNDIKVLRKQQETLYKNVVSVYCSILNDTVYFTSKGFNHLLYESYNRPRSINEQYMKLMCLTHAPEVIKKCTVISKTRKMQRKIKGVWKSGVHYELVYEVSKGNKIRVIVEKIGTGKYRFLSVMRHGRKNKTKKHP